MPKHEYRNNVYHLNNKTNIQRSMIELLNNRQDRIDDRNTENCKNKTCLDKIIQNES